MSRLANEHKRILAALSDPNGETYIGGFDICAVFELERKGLVMSKPDPIFPSFLAYQITPAGRAALEEG